jgi:predicted neuraminidase
MYREQVIAEGLHPPACHSATIEELENHELFAVWYAGSFEGAKDTILMSSRYKFGSWERPQVLVFIPGLPLGNPVLDYTNGELVLYFVILYGDWWTESRVARIASKDNGYTWSQPVLVHEQKGLMLRTKPLHLEDGLVLLPVYDEINWSPLILRSTDEGQTWELYGDTTARGKCIQPTLVELPDKSVLMLTRSNLGKIYMSRSFNKGESWTASQPTELNNPNSGIDVVSDLSGRLILSYNPREKGRTILALSLSTDWGDTWEQPQIVIQGPGEYSYPTIMRGSTGRYHLVFTRNREAIHHIEFDQDWVLTRDERRDD